MRTRGRGFTLIELVVAIVIVGIAVAGVMSVYVVTARSGADPAVRQQAQYIAEAYLDEILLKRFYDPDTNNVCPANEGAANRSLYDNVCDYSTLPDTKVRDQSGAEILALTNKTYSVAVSVDSSAGVALHTVNNTGATRVLLVTVTVTHAATGTAVALSGYRTNYLCNIATDAECKP